MLWIIFFFTTSDFKSVSQIQSSISCAAFLFKNNILKNLYIQFYKSKLLLFPLGGYYGKNVFFSKKKIEKFTFFGGLIGLKEEEDLVGYCTI